MTRSAAVPQLFRTALLTALACACAESSAPEYITTAADESSAASKTPAYELTVLPTLWGYSEALAISETGLVVGFSTRDDGDSHAVLWDDGVLIDMGTLGGPVSHALDVNARGEAAGWAVTADGLMHAFRWSDGRMVDLTPGDVRSRAHGIGPNGRVVGQVLGQFGEQQAAVWESGQQTLLPSLGGTESSAEGVNAAGDVVGWSARSDGRRRAVIWRDGAVSELGTLGGNESFARAISESGTVVGMAETTDGSYHAFRWRAGVMEDLGTLNGGQLSDARGISASGIIVGRHIDDRPQAIAWLRGSAMLLPDLPASRDARAYDVNGRGDIVGYSLIADVQGARPVIWSRR